MRLRPKILLVAAVPLVLFSHCSLPERELPLTPLRSDFEALRAEFNQDAGKVRLLLLLDPT